VDRVLMHMQVAEERIYLVGKDTALKARTSSKPERDMSKVKCYGCGKMGHFKRDCKSKKAKRAVSPAEQSVAMVAQQRRSAESSAAESAAESIEGKRMEWILDSGVSSHIVNDAAAARNITPTRQKVTMVDGTVVAARGVCKLEVVTLVNDTNHFTRRAARAGGTLQPTLAERSAR
jgi:hypothetical protein